MIWAIDMDGVITSNPHFFQWWTHQLVKNDNWVTILTARNPKRVQATLEELKKWDISYNEIATMGDDLPRDYKTQGEWKIKYVIDRGVDIWVDNEFKVYERVCGVDFSQCKAKRINI